MRNITEQRVVEGAQTAFAQSFTYDVAGRMRTNSQVGTYAYAKNR